ncbi:MAG: HlyD family efflux transporter periplasmic adaptor subunit [Bacteroidota bacterium]
MDRPISQEQQKKSRRSQWMKFGWIILLLVALIFAFRRLISPSADTDKLRFATVERGSVEHAITASGLIIPAYEQVINAPAATTISKVNIQSGAAVSTGDLIMELDAEYVRLNYEQLVDEVALKRNSVAKLKLEYDKNLRDLELEDEIKALELSSLQAQLVDTKRLKGIGGATEEEVQKADLALKIAQLEKKKLENNLGFRKKSIGNDRRGLELEVQIQQKKLRELQRKLTETSVIAPQAGVLTWVNDAIGSQVTEGEALVRLANLTRFRVEATSSDMYANQIKTGLPVRVRINKTDLDGTIASILPAVENNTVKFNVDLESPDSDLLRPNMQVEVFIVTNRKQDVLRVVNGPAFTGARVQDIFVLEGDVAKKRSLQIGLNNIDYVEISGDIRKGDRIIISDMKKYEHIDEINLND